MNTILTLNILILIFNLIYFGFIYRQNQKLIRRDRQLRERQGRLDDQADDVIRQVLQKSLAKARENLTEADYFKKEMIASLEEELKQAIADCVKQFDIDTVKFKKEYQEVVTDSVNLLKNKTQTEIKELEQALEQQTVKTEEQIRTQTQADFAKVKVEIENYKQRRISEIEAQISAIVENIVKQATGKLISTADHQQILKDALDQAKKENLI